MQKNKTCSHILYIIGPEEEQQEVEAHHTILFGDGDCVKVENKVSKRIFSFFGFLGGFVVYGKSVKAALCSVTTKFSPQTSEASHFVFIAGEPIKEPVVQHGTLLCYFVFSLSLAKNMSSEITN